MNSKILRILLIEDNPGDARLIEEMLKEAKVEFELICIDRLSSGIGQIKLDGFNVILLDLGLPDSQGLATLTKLNEIKPDAPVIVLTGLADETIGIQAVKEGAQDYLIKGQVDKNLLSRSIRYAIQRNLTEEKVRMAVSQWQTTFDAITDSICIIDLNGKILQCNKATSSFLGKPISEIIGSTCWELVHGRSEPVEGCPIIRMNKTLQKETLELHVSGKWLNVVAEPILDDKGNLIGAVHIISDITERKKAEEDRVKIEEQLRQAQKIEAVGTLASGVAHDFNNILSAIIGYGHLALMKMREDDPLRNNVEQILEASERATALTQSLLAFGRKQPVHFETIDLNGLIKRFEKFLLRLLREDIELKIICTADEIMLSADHTQLEQVLMNLATNARDAMPRGGSLTITTSVTRIDEDFFLMHGYGRTGKYALLTVIDTGTGMDNETKARIFDPFFTTKEQGKGTGLGLSMVYGIIKKHEGFINVYSEIGKGTTFKIYLPVSRAADGTAKEDLITPKSEIQIPQSKGETILIAEDDASLRKLTKTVLEHFGYCVIETIDGQDAVEKFVENKDKIQLVLLDMIMPKKSGKEAYEEIRKTGPGVKTLFLSGYTMDTITIRELTDSGFDFISKPVTPKELLKKVREILDR